jgi:hypothetical protein
VWEIGAFLFDFRVNVQLEVTLRMKVFFDVTFKFFEIENATNNSGSGGMVNLSQI